MKKSKALVEKKKEPRILATGDDALKMFKDMFTDNMLSRKGDAVVEAQEIIYDAWEATNKNTRISKAKKALEISTDCADAYLILGAEQGKTPEKAAVYYREGVKAGERALGKKAFKEDVGYFWGIL